MAQTLTNLLTHIIFSTKGREPLIRAEDKSDLLAYMGGIVREVKGLPLIINGTQDNVHLLVQLPPTLCVSDALRVIKANSSKWLRQQSPAFKNFAWQNGYGAFSVSRSNAKAVIEYIQNQEEHHCIKTFQEEYLAFLRKYGVAYDERYLWD